MPIVAGTPSGGADELRRMPEIHGGALPDGTEIRPCPIPYGT